MSSPGIFSPMGETFNEIMQASIWYTYADVQAN